MTSADPVRRPLVTVVSASLNARDALARTLASVATQSCRDFEHVVVDGASQDGTTDLLRDNSHVRWISEADGGIADALNKGIAMAQGDYIFVLQAGDRFLSSESLSLAVQELACRPDLLAFPVLVEEEGDLRLAPARGLGRRSLFHMPMPHQGLFASRDLFARVGTFDTSYRIAMDYEWLLRARNLGVQAMIDARPLSVMPADGVSSRRDWLGLRQRLMEFRRAQFTHARGSAIRAALHLYWTLYPAYRRGRSAFPSGLR